MAWPLHHAKQQFSQLVDTAREHGPQIVTRNGKEVVAVVAIEEYRRLSAPTPGEVLLGGAKSDAFVEVMEAVVAERRASLNVPRELDL